MIPFEDAERLVRDHAWSLPSEPLDLAQAAGRVLAQAVASDLEMPPFDKAMVDGFACRREDLPGELDVEEEIPAGVFPTLEIRPGQCARIMTGAPVPQGVDCVVMIEHTTQVASTRIRVEQVPAGSNIAPRAQDVHVGQTVLKPGRRLTPQDVAVLAAVGCTQPHVSKRPRVGVIATGSELVPPEVFPGPGQIRNSNAAQLSAAAAACGADVRDYGIAEDTVEAQTAMLHRALDENDVVLTSGGVSVGDFDLIPDIIDGAGLTIHLRKIAMQPGKPMVFATHDGRACFGLSGNPVSSFVQFILFVRPFLMLLQGAGDTRHQLTLPLGEAFKRKPGDRLLWRPAVISDEDTYLTTPYHGSGHINALSAADALVSIPVGSDGLPRGERVAGRLLGI